MVQTKEPPRLRLSTLVVAFLVLGLVVATMLAAGLAAALDLSPS